MTSRVLHGVTIHQLEHGIQSVHRGRFLSVALHPDEFEAMYEYILRYAAGSDMRRYRDLPGRIEGVIQIGERSIPVINFAVRLEVVGKRKESDSRVVVLNRDNPALGLVVNDVPGIMKKLRELLRKPSDAA